MRWPATGLVLVAALAFAAPAVAQEPSKPNVVLLMTDDQTVGDMEVMPMTRRLIGGRGVTFTRSFVSYPLCCPSRATFLTGQYAHNNGVHCLYKWCHGGYGHMRTDEYLPRWLEDVGYATGHIGKYLNGYGSEWDAVVPPGWTDWHGLVDHTTYRMWGYKMNENGRTRQYGRPRAETARSYQTDVLAGKALAFIAKQSRAERPFFLSVAFLAPHHESDHVQRLTGQLVRPAPRHRGRFRGRRWRLPASYDEQDVSDKPSFLARWHTRLTPLEHLAILEHKRLRRESLLAVDEAVASIVGRLADVGELENTYVIFTSDNGFMQGEHRVPFGKMLPYDPSTQVPLLVRGPLIPRGRSTKALVGNVDLAPTILEAAGARAGLRLDGRSFLPFARDVRLRSLRPLLHETAGMGAFGRHKREEGAKGLQPKVPAWRAVRTTRWLYVDYQGRESELYDLRRDPAQLQSLVGVRRYLGRLRTLRRMLADLTDCAGRECRRRADPSVR
jgi:arylsulfatase A-like enzyme